MMNTLNRTSKFDVYGIGNALVDILVEVPDNLITELKLTKGRQHLISEAQSAILFEKLKYAHATIAAGGSAANAVAMLGMLGADAAFCGAVGNDEYGDTYETETKNANVHSLLQKQDK